MHLSKVIAIGLLLGSAYVAADDCVIPSLPEVPEGSDASMEQMIAIQKAVKVFQADNLDYMACLEPALNTAGENAKKTGSKEEKSAAKALYTEQEATYNAAVSIEEKLVSDFNAAIRAYKAASPG